MKNIENCAQEFTLQVFQGQPRISRTKNSSTPEIASVRLKPTNNIKKDIPDPIRHPPKISVLLIIESPQYQFLVHPLYQGWAFGRPDPTRFFPSRIGLGPIRSSPTGL